MKNYIILSVVFILFSILACEKEETAVIETQVFTVKNGTVIGNINSSDYRHEIEISPTSINYQIQDRENNVLKTCSSAETTLDWNQITAKIDFEKFKILPNFYGTSGPALGDIGYEYLEIDKGTETHRISFPTGTNVNEIADLLTIIRKKRDNSEKSCK